MIETTYTCDLCKKKSTEKMQDIIVSVGRNSEYNLQGKTTFDICDDCLKSIGISRIGKSTPRSSMDDLFNNIVEEVRQNI